MATDELSSKLSRRLQIEDGAEEPVAVDEGGQGHENGAGEEKAATANADSELGAKLMRRGELNDGVGEHHQPSMKVFNPYTEFKEFSRKQIKDMERMFKQWVHVVKISALLLFFFILQPALEFQTTNSGMGFSSPWGAEWCHTHTPEDWSCPSLD